MGALVAVAVVGQKGLGLRLSTWIVRWLVSPRTIQGALKKASVQCSLTAGRVVLIQTAPIWEGTFPGTMVKSSAVVDASRDCPIGGFAILLSAR